MNGLDMGWSEVDGLPMGEADARGVVVFPSRTGGGMETEKDVDVGMCMCSMMRGTWSSSSSVTWIDFDGKRLRLFCPLFILC